MSEYWSDEDVADNNNSEEMSSTSEAKEEKTNYGGGTKSAKASAASINAGRWTREEHGKFLEGLKLHGKEWKKIADLIKTRTVVQIRTHAQKYFQKLAKSTGGPVMSTSKKDDVVRPPARKRKATDPEVNDIEVAPLGPPSSTYRKPDSIKVPPQRQFTRTRKPVAVEDKDTGGATPRTVAAATILLRPRLQQKIQSGGDTPKTRETAAWLAANQANATAVLDRRRISRATSSQSNNNMDGATTAADAADVLRGAMTWEAVASSH